MAKSDSFFGLRRGSTKTLTFSVLKGKQITKDRVEGGRNPRTPEQMVQRMCMATASAAYAQMKQIVDHSFEGITYGQTTMSEFIRVNADALRQSYLAGEDDKFSYNPYRDRLMYAGAYIMSRGSASPILRAGYEFMTSSGGDKFTIALHGGKTALGIRLALGLEVGDMATICVLYENDADGDARFVFLRVTILQDGATPLTDENINQFLKLESNAGFPNVTITASTLLCELNAPGFIDSEDPVYALCAIHSKKQNGKWLRSSAAFDVTSYPVRPSAADALETYPLGPSYVLNGGAIED